MVGTYHPVKHSTIASTKKWNKHTWRITRLLYNHNVTKNIYVYMYSTLIPEILSIIDHWRGKNIMLYWKKSFCAISLYCYSFPLSFHSDYASVRTVMGIFAYKSILLIDCRMRILLTCILWQYCVRYSELSCSLRAPRGAALDHYWQVVFVPWVSYRTMEAECPQKHSDMTKKWNNMKSHEVYLPCVSRLYILSFWHSWHC